ncbi:MAG TPA: MlaD family protein, partial [Acidimicrobiales bacterium]|nr:MlaD family protein [Acidimicrobiales bacterium]
MKSGASRWRALVAVVVAASLASLLTACSSRSAMTITATFDDVGDLQIRHAVQVADVRVGRVAKISLTKDFRAEVRMYLGPNTQVPKDSVAVLRTTSLLGEKFIELRPKGEPDAGPFLADGDRLAESLEAPELEFVAQQAVQVLASVASTDVASLIEAGSEAFGGRLTELRSLVVDLATISRTLVERSTEITSIIDGLDRATATLAAGRSDIEALLTNLATTTRILADDREKAVVALDQLGRLAHEQNRILDRYTADIDRQIGQVDAILQVAARQSAEVVSLIDWLARFAIN